jgi:pheromone shutdown protein TraB
MPRGASGDLPAAAVLEHPNGARVYLVGTAHVDPQSALDAREVVERVAPAILVLEVDPERFAAAKSAAGDKFDTKRYIIQSDWELAKMALGIGRISSEAYISVSTTLRSVIS